MLILLLPLLLLLSTTNYYQSFAFAGPRLQAVQDTWEDLCFHHHLPRTPNPSTAGKTDKTGGRNHAEADASWVDPTIFACRLCVCRIFVAFIFSNMVFACVGLLVVHVTCLLNRRYQYVCGSKRVPNKTKGKGKQMTKLYFLTHCHINHPAPQDTTPNSYRPLPGPRNAWQSGQGSCIPAAGGEGREERTVRFSCFFWRFCLVFFGFFVVFLLVLVLYGVFYWGSWVLWTGFRRVLDLLSGVACCVEILFCSVAVLASSTF